MQKIFLVFTLLALTEMAMASPICDAPRSNWIKEVDFQKELKRQGYLIKTFKIINGCYEIYGLDPLGKRVQIYFDPTTGTSVKSE